MLIPIQTAPVSWQLLQEPVIPVWIWVPLGGEFWNSVPGATVTALALIIPIGIADRWQVSQAVVDGMCEPEPTGEVGGMTTMLATPAKLLPLTVGP
jgi:hypothetical protein